MENQSTVVNQPSVVSQPVETQPAVVSQPTVVTPNPSTTVGAPSTETVAVEVESSHTVKKREYPDLSFLSDPSLQVEKAVASWDQSDNEPLNMFVLHHSARINSYVRIENPMLGRIALAKVIGRLPNNIKDSQVKMIVSTAVANSLGVVDDKFLTEIKFVQ